MVTQQRRSHPPDLENSIGLCPRRIRAPKREAYPSIKTGLQKPAGSSDQGSQIQACDLLDCRCSNLYMMEIDMARLKIIWNDDRPDRRGFIHPLRDPIFRISFPYLPKKAYLHLPWTSPGFDHRWLDFGVGKAQLRPANVQWRTGLYSPPVRSRALTNGKLSLT